MNYVIETQEITAAEMTPARCNAIQFVNKGTATAYVNDLPLATDESFAFSGHELEMDVTRYRIRFGNTGTGRLFVVRKRYVGGVI